MTCKHCKKQVSNSHYCEEAQRTINSDDQDDLLISAVVGGITDNAILGGLVGGSLIGGIVGDLMGDGELF